MKKADCGTGTAVVVVLAKVAMSKRAKKCTCSCHLWQFFKTITSPLLAQYKDATGPKGNPAFANPRNHSFLDPCTQGLGTALWEQPKNFNVRKGRHSLFLLSRFPRSYVGHGSLPTTFGRQGQWAFKSSGLGGCNCRKALGFSLGTEKSPSLDVGPPANLRRACVLERASTSLLLNGWPESVPNMVRLLSQS